MSVAHVTTSPFDENAAGTFAERIMADINDSAVVTMISIGHRAGLFDVLAGLPPMTSTEIAQTAELDERYIREWLAVMVTGRIVVYEPARKLYHLPAEHAACLTRDAPLGNLAVYSQFIALMGRLQDRVLECFESGEGLGYHEFPHFHDMMAEDSGQTVIAGLFDTILPLAEGLIARLDSGIDVLDAGCGRGAALIAMAERFPDSRFVGYDLSTEAIAFATAQANASGLGNVRFEARDLTGFDERERYDFVATFDAVHDQKDPEGLVRGLFGALKPGGVYLMQDIGGSAYLEKNMDFPMASFLYAISLNHCMPVSLGQGGDGLGTMWGWETAQAMLEKAGFGKVERNILDHDPMNVWFVSRKT